MRIKKKNLIRFLLEKFHKNDKAKNESENPLVQSRDCNSIV